MIDPVTCNRCGAVFDFAKIDVCPLCEMPKNVSVDPSLAHRASPPPRGKRTANVLFCPHCGGPMDLSNTYIYCIPCEWSVKRSEKDVLYEIAKSNLEKVQRNDQKRFTTLSQEERGDNNE